MIKQFKRWVKNLRKKSLPAYQSGWVQGTGSSNFIQFTNANTSLSTTPYQHTAPTGDVVADQRIVKKPVEVVNEIVVDQPVLDLNNLDQQIKIVKRRIDVLDEQSVPLADEYEALGYLKARQKYKKYANLFRWSITTQEKVDELCRTYKVQVVNFASYAKNVPNEALDELEKFANAYEKIRDDKPQLSLITDYQGPEHRKDPILLARSPFGRWYYILGAWDKEVEIVDDLIYKGK